MNNHVYLLDRGEADSFAEDYFLSICGLKNREGSKYTVVSGFDGEVLSGNTATIGATTFICNGFQQLKKDKIHKIYAYILTAGSFELDDNEPVLEQLYADIWGTAYTDAGLEVLKAKLVEEVQRETGNQKTAVLEPFGPGFYGMDVDQVGKFFEVLDGDR
ncbi:MAG: hypothetical protein K0Q48_503, partial [Bacillota bacterium]|nr:hypothetical protein [Bacillota bacterium]